MGALSTLLTIAIGIYAPANCRCIWVLSLIVAILWGLYSIYPKKRIFINFPQKRNIQIRIGDLFSIKEKNGIIVIPVNNYLDTQLENDIVGYNTIHGKFIIYYQRHYIGKDLDAEISRAIARDEIKSSKSMKKRKAVLNRKLESYPLGTVVRLIESDKQYYLVVATEFDEDNHVIHQPEKFTYMLLQMMKWINKYNSGHPVYLPLIGSGQTGLNLSKQKALCHLLYCFSMVDHYVTTGGTTILVYPNDKKDISLNQILYEFKNLK